MSFPALVQIYSQDASCETWLETRTNTACNS